MTLTTQNDREILLANKELIKQKLMDRIKDAPKIRAAREKRIRRAKRWLGDKKKHIGLIIDNGKMGRFENDFEFTENQEI